jgi:photosystem II stability/assembly factor-like uncharacterized protein
MGPDGGDVRSLAYDPRDPRRIFLGTSAGRIFLSADGGNSWTRFAHLGGGDDFVLDHIVIDPVSGTMYVSAWTVEHESGDVFRSSDEGRSWQALRDMHGKSIRALALAPSDSRTIVAGALDGIFRSRDGGDSWERISPAGHLQIKNIESLAIDPRDKNVIYAGTWHLPWKTIDGGGDWRSIKQGVIDDSDVFSIILDRSNPSTVYLSACSGVYKSANSGELFYKIHGIPSAAQRTRVLRQDPRNPATVYAGTTEGLWKTVDAGQDWQLISTPNIIVNDVLVDPGNSNRVLIATDRGGVLASEDGGHTFSSSNLGFAHRQVWSVLADRFNPGMLYAGVVNDKEFGGVFEYQGSIPVGPAQLSTAVVSSHDPVPQIDSGKIGKAGRLVVAQSGTVTAAAGWKQVSSGIEKLDVFTLAQAENGDVIAGTNHGIFAFVHGTDHWEPMNTLVRPNEPAPASKPAPRKHSSAKHVAANPAAAKPEAAKSSTALLDGRVTQLFLGEDRWFAAAADGLLVSFTHGKSWVELPMEGYRDFVAVQAMGRLVLAVSSTAAFVSQNNGDTWHLCPIEDQAGVLYGGIITDGNALWLAGRKGAFRSRDLGMTWQHVGNDAGLAPHLVTSITYDREGHRLLAVAGAGTMYVSSNEGVSWEYENTGFALRTVTAVHGRLLAMTAFDGLIVEPEASVPQEPKPTSIAAMPVTQ